MRDLLGRLTEVAKELDAQLDEQSVVASLSRAVLADGLSQLLDRLAALRSGHLHELSAEGACDLLWRFAELNSTLCIDVVMSDCGLRDLTSTSRARLLSLLEQLLRLPVPLTGEIRIVAGELFRVFEAPDLVHICVRGIERGLGVRVVEEPEIHNTSLSIQLCSEDKTCLRLTQTPAPQGAGGSGWTIDLRGVSDKPSDVRALDEAHRRDPAEYYVQSDFAAACCTPQIDWGAEILRPLSVFDLFGNNIALRDLEPRTPHVRGLSQLRSSLGFAEDFTPRKNQAEYASVLLSYLGDLVPAGPAHVIYVGDTLFNDGSAIHNLSNASNSFNVWGFLCNEKRGAETQNLRVGNIYFAERWSALVSCLSSFLNSGLCLNERTIGLFDLDQTVYAAKGRDDVPLKAARWDAILSFLRDTVPAHRYEPQRAQAVYQEFDQDIYHRLTRDNMDYIVLLVLAVAAGLCDSGEIRSLAHSSQQGILSLAEELYHRASGRSRHEDLGRVLSVIRAVYYNALAGDQTPCKDFRRYECKTTAERMETLKPPDGGDPIFLNREVVELIEYLRDHSCQLMAISDRPPEAAVVSDEESSIDLMLIPMQQRGVGILRDLRILTST